MNPILVVIRRELRLADNPLLREAEASGRAVIPVFILDEVFQSYGSAPLWRLGLGVQEFARSLEGIGSRLIFRRGNALATIRALVAETGADTVRWGRSYDPDQVARDRSVITALSEDGLDCASVACHLLFEPWSAETKQGGYYRVYSPFWRAVKDRAVPPSAAPVNHLPPPDLWPESESTEDWNLARPMNRGADVVAAHLCLGEDKARERLDAFVEGPISTYKDRRDFPGEAATSNLSENLAWGEISVRLCYHAARRALELGKPGAAHFIKELIWREFAYHLVWHSPEIVSRNWRSDWDTFPWTMNRESPEALAWMQGRTGIRFVDAAMREMYVTGRMHNRARMIVASYLTKHLMTHWKVGLDWFADCLVDWDPASNAMGWQWVAGSGPDAAPYFRVFNPVTQLEKFDAKGPYQNRWIAEGELLPTATALSYFDAVPRSWGLSPKAPYPNPIVSVEDGRKRALAAYEARSF